MNKALNGMDLDYFAGTLAEICGRSLVAPGRPLVWTVIANPSAGGFTIKSRWKKNRLILEEYRQKALANPIRAGSCPSETAKQMGPNSSHAEKYNVKFLSECGMVLTERPGHGVQIAEALINEAATHTGKSTEEKWTGEKASAAPQTEHPFYLFITAGGDGTSLEVLSALYRAPAHVRESAAVLRLPMGTGNDGADAPTLDGALDLLVRQVNIENTAALRLVTSPLGPAFSKGPFLAFNILSVGLDAFVTHMTNRMKGRLPGDSYKLWVDIASLLYDRLYTVGTMDLKALDEQGAEVTSLGEKILLLAVGVTGHRTYGSHKKILPDERNVCALRQMSLLRKLALKGLFNTGGHITKPEAVLFSAHRVEFSAVYPILAQMDGETVLLVREDFPAAIELTEKVIPVLKPAR
jgi:diacylglycerol kinase family enzyme